MLSRLFLPINPWGLLSSHYNCLGNDYHILIITFNFFLIPSGISILLVYKVMPAQEVLTSLIMIFSLFTPFLLTVTVLLSSVAQGLVKEGIKRNPESENEMNKGNLPTNFKEVAKRKREKREKAWREKDYEDFIRHALSYSVYALFLSVVVLLFLLCLFLFNINSWKCTTCTFFTYSLSFVKYFLICHFFITFLLVLNGISDLVKSQLPS